MEEMIKDEKENELALRAVTSIEKGEDKKEETPIDEVIKSLADFTKEAFSITLEQTKLTKALEDSFIDDIKNGSMSTAERISLYNVQQSAQNDRISRMMNPTSQMINEKNRAQIESDRRKEQMQQQALAGNGGTNLQLNIGTASAMDAKVASTAPAEVTLGLLALNNMLGAMKTEKPTEKAAEQTN